MSQKAFQIYEEALKEQHTRNEARRIRTRVVEARGKPHSAGLRWPFELFQNALDAGPRVGRASVTICLRREQSHVLFEHDGAPFTSVELAALLSGGSSKEFESDETTGRFGTGFLVTHVLAERVGLCGLLDVPTGCEQFSLTLDRGGDEDAILTNIHSCSNAILAAVPVSELDSVPSARFEYAIGDDDALVLGFEALTSALPYLYATRQSLGRVELQKGKGAMEVWTPGKVIREALGDGFVEHRLLRVEHINGACAELRVFRFMSLENAGASALVVVDQTESDWKVRLPAPDAPRLYREYPLRGSSFVPIGFVLDGKFEPEQERSGLLMSDKDKELLKEAFAAAVVAANYAINQRWEGAHLLGRARKPSTAFDSNDPDEKEWWSDQLFGFADRIARLAIVDCTSRFLPASSADSPYADFVIPRLLPNSTIDETTVERMWPLVDAATDLLPPRRELAQDWTDISEGWHELGLELGRITLSRLADYVRKDAQTLDELRVDGNRKEWLANFLDIVGECWRSRSGVETSVLTGILPNQNQRLCSPDGLRHDDGISDRIKDICADMGHDVRNRLLLQGFNDMADPGPLRYLPEMLAKAISKRDSEDDVIEEVVRYLDAKFPEDKDCDEESLGLQGASVSLLCYLWESKGASAAAIAHRMPLITSKQRAVRWSHDRMMMAPVCIWHESARPFETAYPPHRVLNELYAGSEENGIPNCVPVLVSLGIAIADPITTYTPAELEGRRLAAISSGDTVGIAIRRETFSQIALLQPDVLNRCKVGENEARALLGLVLCHVAPNDPAWREERIVRGHRGRDDVDVRVRGALWLADLKFMAWVPIVEEDAKSPVPRFANAQTLDSLLDPAWLQNNDAAIRLLTECFGLDELEMRLLGVAPDAETRKELRDSLAKLVETGGANLALYASLANEIEARQRHSRDVERCRRLGLAVQEAVKLALESHGLKLELVDRGFDYEVTLPAEDVLEEAAIRFEVGPYLLEVKATTTGGARLTPMQAETASAESSRYVLCVVDLRNLTDEDLAAEWTAASVESLARIVPDIGGMVKQTCSFIEAAKTSSVGIRNASALRYEVPASTWEAGISVTEWVMTIEQHQTE